MTREEKIDQLRKIAIEIKSFKGLEIAKKATNAVPGEGNPDAEILFIGEAPGFNEDRLGRPFVGQAGKLLDKAITENLGLKRTDVYITNIVKFRPPENRDPTPEEIDACRDWLDRQIAIIKPKYIVTLGRFSMAKYIPDVTISRVHGLSRKLDEFIIFPMYHPAAALRSGEMMKAFLDDFNKLKNLLFPQIIPPTVINSKPEQTQGTLF